MNQPTSHASRLSRRHLIAGGAGAVAGVGAASLLPSGSLSASSHPIGGQLMTLFEPIRLFDSRDPDSFFNQKFTDGDQVHIIVGAPEMASAAFVNLTITQTEGAGYLSVQAADSSDDPPVAMTSAINWTDADVTLANLVLSRVGIENSIMVSCSGAAAATHVIVDLQGYVPFEWDDAG